MIVLNLFTPYPNSWKVNHGRITSNLDAEEISGVWEFRCCGIHQPSVSPTKCSSGFSSLCSGSELELWQQLFQQNYHQRIQHEHPAHPQVWLLQLLRLIYQLHHLPLLPFLRP
jgi:hypothetical protein